MKGLILREISEAYGILLENRQFPDRIEILGSALNSELGYDSFDDDTWYVIEDNCITELYR